jgi:hypothetical protein
MLQKIVTFFVARQQEVFHSFPDGAESLSVSDVAGELQI